MQNLFVHTDDVSSVLGCTTTTTVCLKRFLFADIPTGRIPGEDARKKGMEVYALCQRLSDRLKEKWTIEHSALLVAKAQTRLEKVQ
jgi:hypothetical protein